MVLLGQFGNIQHIFLVLCFLAVNPAADHIGHREIVLCNRNHNIDQSIGTHKTVRISAVHSFQASAANHMLIRLTNVFTEVWCGNKLIQDLPLRIHNHDRKIAQGQETAVPAVKVSIEYLFNFLLFPCRHLHAPLLPLPFLQENDEMAENTAKIRLYLCSILI